ncbi:MAG: FtsX-like permease family protein [Candidatus Bathyarchaeia archaeon]
MIKIIYGLKMLVRKGGTASAILSIALLVAVIASMSSVANYIALQSRILGRLTNPDGAYIIIGGDIITDSKISAEISHELSSIRYVKSAFPQKVLLANLTTGFRTSTVYVRGVDDVDVYLKLRGAYVNGTAAKDWNEADVGEVLANALSISIGDEMDLAFNGGGIKIKAVGVFRSRSTSDAEIIVSMEAVNKISGDNGTVSIIEFYLREGKNRQEVISQIARLLPENIKVLEAQQLSVFAQQVSGQTLVFLNIWSLTVYAIIAVASYVIALRLIAESRYEFTMLRVLGAGKKHLFILTLTYTAATALIASVLGIALGIAGAQTASTMFRWINPAVDITPFLEAEQVLKMLLLTLASSTLGCTHPALKSTRIKYVEQQI